MLFSTIIRLLNILENLIGTLSLVESCTRSSGTISNVVCAGWLGGIFPICLTTTF